MMPPLPVARSSFNGRHGDLSKTRHPTPWRPISRRVSSSLYQNIVILMSH